MKQYVGETESNWRFWKNVKTCLRNIKVYLGIPSRHGHFHLLLILPVKMVELRSNMPILSIGCIPLCKFLSLPIVAKSSILNVTDLLDPPLKNSPCMKTSPDSCETSLFLIVLKCCPLYPESLYFSVTLTVWWSIFGQPFSRWI